MFDCYIPTGFGLIENLSFLPILHRYAIIDSGLTRIFNSNISCPDEKKICVKANAVRHEISAAAAVETEHIIIEMALDCYIPRGLDS